MRVVRSRALLVHELLHVAVNGSRDRKISTPQVGALEAALLGEDDPSLHWVVGTDGRLTGTAIAVNVHELEHDLIELATLEMLAEHASDALLPTSTDSNDSFEPQATLNEVEEAIDEFHKLLKQRINTLRRTIDGQAASSWSQS